MEWKHKDPEKVEVDYFEEMCKDHQGENNFKLVHFRNGINQI